MFMFDRKQKTLVQEKVEHTFIEKVLNVVKERVDNSQRKMNKLEKKIIGFIETHKFIYLTVLLLL